MIDGQVVQTITADQTMVPPNYAAGSVSFTAPASGTVTIGFSSQSSSVRGVVLDNVRLFSTSTGESDIGPLSDADASADEVNESAAPGTQVGITAEAIDPDAGDSATA